MSNVKIYYYLDYAVRRACEEVKVRFNLNIILVHSTYKVLNKIIQYTSIKYLLSIHIL